MNNEDLFARKIINHLESSLDGVPLHIQARLNNAREIALSKAKKEHIHLGGGVLGFRFSVFRRKTLSFSFLILLLITLFFSHQYILTQSTATEAAELDEEILGDDAPVQAYTDPVFTNVFRSGAINSSKNTD